MSTKSNQAPSRVPLPSPEEVTGHTRELYEELQRSRGENYVANVFRALGNSPGALERTTAVGEHVRYHTEFEAHLRELMILTVAQEVRSAYEWTHHYRIAQRLGIAEETLRAVGSEALEEQLGVQGAALRYVRLVANNQEVDDSTVETVRAQFGIAGFVDMTVLAAYYVMLALCLNTWRVPCEVELVAFNR